MILIILLSFSLSIVFSCKITVSNLHKFWNEKYIEQNELIVKQTMSVVEQRLNYVLEQVSKVEKNETFSSIALRRGEPTIQERLEITNIFENERFNNSDLIDSIIFIRNDGCIFYEYPYKIRNSQTLADILWYKEAIDAEPYLIWYPSHKRELFRSATDTQVFTMAKTVLDKAMKPVGILAINLKTEYIEREIKNINRANSIYTYIVDKQGRTVFDKDPSIEGKYTVFKKEKGRIYDDKNAVIYDTMFLNNWVFVTVIDNKTMIEDLYVFKNTMWITISLIIAVFAVFAILFTMWLTRPLNKLNGVIEQVQNKDMNVRWEDCGRDDEIEQIGRCFNTMMDSINELMQQVSYEKSLHFASQLRTLQEQLNSHFLHNVLDSIYFLVQMGNTEKAAEMTASLAEFIDHVLNDGCEITTVEREIEHIKNYVAIEKIRYGDKFRFEIDIDQSIAKCEMPKLLIQPLVENAINHGLFGCKDGEIKVSAKRKNDFLHFEVADNGCGIEEEKVSALNRMLASDIDYNDDSGYALKNIKNRLYLHYGKDAVVKIESSAGHGCKVTVELPIKDFRAENINGDTEFVMPRKESLGENIKKVKE